MNHRIKITKIAKHGGLESNDFGNVEAWEAEKGCFLPIHPEEFFQLEVPAELDLFQFLRGELFEGQSGLGRRFIFDDYFWEQGPTAGRDWWFSPSNINHFENENRNYIRYAVIIRADEVWQIIGFPLGDDIVYGLRRIWDREVDARRDLADSYLSKRVIIDYSYRSNGPGPVSGRARGALLDMGEWWLGMHSVDQVIVANPVKISESPAAELQEWLEANNAVELFVLQNTTCAWSDLALKEQFEDARWNFLQTARVEVNLTRTETQATLDQVREGKSTAANLLRLLETIDDNRMRLIAKLDRASHENNAAVLLNDWL